MAEVAASAVRQGTPKYRRAFIDSNILLYCDDSKDKAKRHFALNLVIEHLANGSGVVSLQVLQEYFVNVTRKLGLDPGLARQKVETYSRFLLVQPSIDDIFAAVDRHRLHNLSYWDALIVHSARQSGCSTLITEDMQHGQTIDGVRIVNPFL